MNKYEAVIMISPKISESLQNNLLKDVEDKFKQILSINLIKKKDLGRRELAYEIKGYNQGYYMYYEIEEKNNSKKTSNIKKELEKYFKTRYEIIKFLVIAI